MSVEEKFSEVYQKILEENTSEMEESRKEAKEERKQNNKYWTKIMIIDIVIIILTLIFAPILLEFVLSVLALVLLTISTIRMFRGNNDSKIDKFRSDFKTKVVNTLIKSFNQQLEYEPHSETYSYIYKEAEFEHYDEFKSEDLIIGKLENNCEFEMAEVLTQDARKDSEGHIHYSTIFSGLFAKIETPKPFNTMLYLRNDKKDKGFLARALTATLPFNKLRIQLDSEEFEKVFDVYASDKIVAMQLLTADIMQDLLQFYNELGIRYELTIKNNCLYIRFWCGRMFEAAKLDKFSLDRDTLYKYYRILDFTFSLTNKLIKVLNETQY